jgi:hypothetical protein
MVVLAAFTSGLFLLRILAIFRGQRMIIGLFVFLWSAVVGSAILVPLSIHGIHIGPTSYCAPMNVGTRTGVYGVVTMVDRLLVFIFISWRLTDHHNSRIKAFFRGHGLSIISSVLISSGQLYYL